MKTVDYWKKKGFVEIGCIFSSDRLKQGVDVKFKVDKLD